MAAEGAPEWTLVAADHQTAGRGRLGRTWVSEPGALLFSVVLRPRLPPDRATFLTLLAGTAIASACGDAGVDGVRCKWPNDLVTGDGKVGGILTESRVADGEFAFVVVEGFSLTAFRCLMKNGDIGLRLVDGFDTLHAKDVEAIDLSGQRRGNRGDARILQFRHMTRGACRIVPNVSVELELANDLPALAKRRTRSLCRRRRSSTVSKSAIPSLAIRRLARRSSRRLLCAVRVTVSVPVLR